MKISEAARKSGLSIDTIRFYEKSGLVPHVSRGVDGHRRFSPDTIDWLVLLASLRATGMPMRAMRAFAELYAQGDATIRARRQTLLDHAERLKTMQRDLDHCAALLDKKLGIYRDMLGE
ncbi:MAG: MerR family transcriptional regulator [Pseudomonadota bacterium]